MILKAEHISKSFGEKKILDDISICLNEGEIVCILGTSGVGKSTLFNIISGLSKPDEGCVSLKNDGCKDDAFCDITGKSGNISYMLQKDLLLEHKSVIDNVCLPLLIQGVKKEEAKTKALPLFDRFNLNGMEDKFPAQLSGGMRQRAALLRTYMCGDKVALLDEPFSALDTLTRSEIHDWYLQIMDEIKLSTLFITHDIDEAILLSDRIYILKGRPAKIAAEIEICEQKPRNGDFLLSEEFLKYKREIKALL
ncbi:MAG: ABC transporter ATP-binding protein [Lachnospiraceae bacterium]|nr:ABC transporter ATP-binding protein [Lachnospiraceae bacterium]